MLCTAVICNYEQRKETCRSTNNKISNSKQCKYKQRKKHLESCLFQLVSSFPNVRIKCFSLSYIIVIQISWMLVGLHNHFVTNGFGNIILEIVFFISWHNNYCENNLQMKNK